MKQPDGRERDRHARFWCRPILNRTRRSAPVEEIVAGNAAKETGFQKQRRKSRRVSRPKDDDIWPDPLCGPYHNSDEGLLGHSWEFGVVTGVCALAAGRLGQREKRPAISRRPGGRFQQIFAH